MPVMDTFFVYRLVTERLARIICDLTIKIQHVDVFPIDASYGDKFDEVPTWNLFSTTSDIRREDLAKVECKGVEKLSIASKQGEI